jgi:hypothetical protein
MLILRSCRWLETSISLSLKNGNYSIYAFVMVFCWGYQDLGVEPMREL